ncbi:MAG: peptidylprolyl isomerase [Eubacteriales bacterium]
MSKRNIINRMIFLIMMGCVILFSTSCQQIDGNTKIVLTTGLSSGELFRIGESTCQLSEALTYYATMKNQYEEIFGEEIWDYDGATISLEEHLGEVVLARVAQVKVMNLLAEQYEVALTEKEQTMAEDAAAQYVGTLSEEEMQALGLSEELILTMYIEYATAESVYEYMIRDINPEISDDEARIVTVNRLLVSLDSYENAVRAYEELQNGTSFQEVAKAYSELETSMVSFGKNEGVLDAQLEEIAFTLATDEISDIIMTDEGYEIIQCVNTLNREETDENKLKIIEERRKETFNIQYEEYVNSLVKHIDFTMWEEATTYLDEVIETVDFFTIYENLQ